MLRKFLLAASVLACLALMPRSASAAITNATLVNVTPSGFSVLWRSANSTPSIEVFADSGGVTNLAGKVGVETFPLHTGNPDSATAYDRLRSQIALRQKTQNLGQMLVRVTGCKPDTLYYYRLIATPSVGSPSVYPTSGPLPSVRTEKENTFVVDDQQLIIDVPGLDTMGQVVTLNHTNAAHPLAAIVGDGVGTNQVFFNVNDLFSLAGGTNFGPIGTQTFIADVLGPNQTDTIAQFTLNFGTNLVIGGGSQVTIGTEFLALNLGRTVMRAGETNSVPFSFASSVGIADLTANLFIAPNHLTNLVLSGLAPEINPASVSINQQANGTVVIHFTTLSGQFLNGSKALGQFTFKAITGVPSAFVPLTFTSIVGKKGDNTSVGNLIAQSGRAVVIGQEALLEAGFAGNGARGLNLYAKPFATYAIEYATNLAAPIRWTRMAPVAVTSMVTSMPGAPNPGSQIYYRAVEFFADPPVIQAVLNPDKTRNLVVFGQPGTNYTVEYKTNVSNVVPWAPLYSFVMTNSFGATTLPNTNPIVFYRLKRN